MQSRRAYPSDVSDEEWALVAPYLTLLPETSSQREHSLREVFNGLRYVVRYGVAWRAMPHDLPPWHAVYDQAQRWLKAGCFENLVHDLRAVLRMASGRAEEPSAVVLDSRTLRSTPESGARAAWDGHKRTRGSKLHAAVDTLGQVLALHVTPANADDRAAVATLADAVQEATGDSVNLAYVDQGYTGERAAKAAADHGIALEVVKLPEAKRGPHPELVEGRAAATQMGRRASLRLDGPLPPIGSRLRAPPSHFGRIAPRRLQRPAPPQGRRLRCSP
jgi:transposase